MTPEQLDVFLGASSILNNQGYPISTHNQPLQMNTPNISGLTEIVFPVSLIPRALLMLIVI